MTRKPGIVTHLREENLLLPRAVEDAQEACARGRFRLELLRAACSCGEAVEEPRTDRWAGGEGERARWGDLVAGAEPLGGGGHRVPRVGELLAAVREDLAEMLPPLRFHDEMTTARYARRLDTLAAEAPGFAAHYLSAKQLEHAVGDGVSLASLCTDLCREVAALRRGLASEEVAGATGYHLEPADRERVERFRTGVAAATPEGFEHPGLATLAVRHGARLVLEHDLDTASAEVLLLDVEEREVTISYTDVHRERLRAFRRQLDGFPVQWEDLQRRPIQGLPDRDAYFLLRGRFLATTTKELDRFLEHLGTRLVYLVCEVHEAACRPAPAFGTAAAAPAARRRAS
jgi:hypothetical protein